MSKYAVIGLLVMLAGAAAIVAGALLVGTREGVGLGLIFGGVVVDFIGLFVATTQARRNGAQGNGGNVPSGLSNFLS
ncbi:hypothetical protein [Petropleomorpha daqingensis]|uniref:Uncharacterized protein n=1 Tax=Petropleomorpha daqingensis TaxID=2026353 RepID=A0A853CAC1_9ACTN|nr:hypothetical protein [Petropleomorpha daqingensis]NYJ03966.1 hypothetical protein [Petropleomorpha daqingensis]